MEAEISFSTEPMETFPSVPKEEKSSEDEDEMIRLPFTRFLMKRTIAITYLSSVLYNVAFFAPIMQLPYIVKTLQISDADYGFLQTFFGMLQMIGGPLFGYLCQRMGIINGLNVVYISNIISSICMYFSRDLTMLYLSRLPSLFLHGQQAHQTLLAVLTKPGQERTVAFGRMGLTFGFGFIFVPLMQIVVTFLFSENAVLIAAALVSIAAIVLLNTTLDSNLEKQNRDQMDDENKSTNLRAVLQIANRPGVLVTYAQKNLVITPMILVFSVMQLHLINAFQVSVLLNSLIQMLVGVCVMFANGFGVVWLRKRYKEDQLLIIGIGFMMTAFLLLSVFQWLWLIVIILPAVAMGMSTVGTVADSQMTSFVQQSEHGIVLGVSHSTNALMRTFAPALGGYLMQNVGFWIFGQIGMAICVAVLIPTVFTLYNNRVENDKEE